ncbi:hypothetical protein C7S13_6050 [Burkholderia cepacia]|nr:hypothetical protein [Burkholderia cepacia]MDW9246978.1 hypothetical protein [Burkholderia cepacia]
MPGSPGDSRPDFASHGRPMQASGRACGTLPHEYRTVCDRSALRPVPYGFQANSIDRPVPIDE